MHLPHDPAIPLGYVSGRNYCTCVSKDRHKIHIAALFIKSQPGVNTNISGQKNMYVYTHASLYIFYTDAHKCMSVWVLSYFSQVQLFATLWTVACQRSLSMGILQARILEWVAKPSSRGSSQSRDRTLWVFTIWATREALFHWVSLYSWGSLVAQTVKNLPAWWL